MNISNLEYLETVKQHNVFGGVLSISQGQVSAGVTSNLASLVATIASTYTSVLSISR